jgi:hypothetical protein
MKRPTSIINLIFITSIFILACSSASLPNLATATAQTIITVPPMPTEFLTQPPMEITESGSGLENENLLTGLPEGFKVGYQAEQNKQTITEMVAEGESVDDWTTMVTVQVYLGETNTTPAQAQQTLTDSWFNACENSNSSPVADGTENGYNFILWQLYCPVNPATQKVEYTYMKAIQGNDSFYLVQVAFRHEPSGDEVTQWMNYLKQVYACDSRIPERACP